MADFEDFEAFKPVTALHLHPKVDVLGEKLCHVVKDRVVKIWVN